MRGDYRLRIITYKCIFTTFCLLFILSVAYAKTEKITILYTGETHSMLYPCDCPLGFSGGVAQRATKINQLRRQNPNVLLVDTGGAFAGGLLDEYTQTVELDRKRTLINLEAMRIIDYDAVAVGDEEFNFGEEFLKQSIKEKNIPFVSSNLESDYVRPFIIRRIGDVKIGIVALSNSEIKNKMTSVKYIGPEQGLKKNVRALQKQGVDIIIVLSHLGEDEDMNLLNRLKTQPDFIEQIDILVTGHRLSYKPDASTKVGETIILRPAWQGRSLGKVDLDIENGKIINYAIDDIAIDDSIKKDRAVSKVLPQCFSDRNCRKKGFIGSCKDQARLFSKCIFEKLEPISLLIIKPKACITCDTDRAISYLERDFGNLKVSYLNYETRKGRNLVNRLGIDMLPAYLLGNEVEKNDKFNSFGKFLIPKEDKYLVDPSILGVSFFTGRGKKKHSLDLFISLYDSNSHELLQLMKDFIEKKRNLKFNLHFLGRIEPERVVVPGGLLELEEDLRSVCVMNNYPDRWWDYFLCRTKNIQSSWWDDCLESCGMNINLIKKCSRSSEGNRLLLENINLSSGLKIRSSGTFLLNNQEIFSAINVPKREELERIVK